MVQAVPFTGFQNLDDPDEVIPSVHHKAARNVVFRGTLPNLRIESVRGTTLINNSLLPLLGVNKTIGRFYDPVKKRIFFFNDNTNDSDGIYVYNTLSGTFQRLVEVGINNSGDPLGFTPDVISNIDIIYGDAAQGDILYWVDTQGRPSKINIDRALSGGYGLIARSFLDVAKEPADIPPYVVYENDSNVTVNNLRKKLFKFKIRWVFDDNDKPVTSSQSVVPVPYAPFSTDIDTNPTINTRIAITYQTGPANVKKVELLAAVSIGNLFSDFFLIASLDKDALSIPDNDVATYLFYNDKAYNYIDVQESIQLFDYVPQTTEAQVLLNGNVLAYGNVTEGYPNLTDFANGLGDESDITPTTTPFYSGIYFTNLIANQGGASAFGSGVIHIVIRGTVLYLVSSLDTYYVRFTDGTNINYTVVLGDDTAAVIEGLRVDAISKGFTIISTGDNDLYILKANIELAGTEIDSNYIYNSILNGSFNAYDWWSKHGWGLVYFDQKGRTNGVVYTDDFSVDSMSYNEGGGEVNIPLFQASIYHRPPTWAYYYQWVRTKDLTKSKLIQWISDRTLKDSNTSLGQDAFAYISIENLNTFVSKNSGTPLGYTFTPNDRIRFIKLFDGSGATVQIYTQKDFEIVSSVVNPTVNGVDYTGQFIKILLPTTSGTFDFGGSSFATYFIELYTPAQSVANGLDVYYEFGERYAIGNAGSGSAFHQGQLQNQTSDLVTPATFEFIKGDYYVRFRTIQTGQEIIYEVTSGFGSDSDAGRITLGLTPTSVSYSDPNITVGDSPYQNLVGFNLATDTVRQILTIVSGTYTFRIRGTITIIFQDVGPDTYPYEFFLQKNDGTKYQLVPIFDGHNPGVYTFQVDTTFEMTTGERIFIFGWAVGNNDNTRSFAATNLTITREAAFSQKVIDPNFSDYYASAVNSNGRAFVFDPDANQVNFPNMYRWSLAYQEDTNINQTSRFYPQNFDTVDRSWGSIQKMRTWNRILTIFQERKCGQTGVYSKFIRDNTGTNQLVTTDDIITSNNIQYYEGNFGCANQPDSIVQSRFVYYFVDPILGKILRLSRDGITDLTELYKAQTWGGENLPNYLKSYSYQFGGDARVTGTFNIRPDNVGEYLLVAQRGTSGSTAIGGETLAFDESKNSFTGFYDYAPECIVCAENVLYSFRNGKMYVHNNTTSYCNFYSVQYEPSITKVYNQNLLQKKTWISLNEVASRIWDCPEIYTGLTSILTIKQQSNLITQDFVELEGQFSASFLKDINSIGGIANGDSLKSEYIVIKFRVPKESAGSFATLSLVSVKFIDSPLNVSK